MKKGILVRTLRLARGTSMALGVAVMLAVVLGGNRLDQDRKQPNNQPMMWF